MRWDKLSGIEGVIVHVIVRCGTERVREHGLGQVNGGGGGCGKQHSERCSGGNVSKGRRWVIGDQTEPLLG